MYITVFMSALLIMPISFDCDSGSIDLWTQLLTRLKQKLQRRKQKRKKTNTFSGMKSSRLKDKDRDENEEEEEDEDEVEEKKVDDTEEERLLLDHESSNVSIYTLLVYTWVESYMFNTILPIGSWVFRCCPDVRTQTQSRSQISESC